MAAVLKTAMGQPIVGSNPTPSASTDTPKPHVRAPVRLTGRGAIMSGCVRPAPAIYDYLCPRRVRARRRAGPVGQSQLEQGFDPCESGAVTDGGCGWKAKGKRCGQPIVGLRDLGPTYGKLRMQYVCKLHANFVDSTERLKRRDPPPAL